MPLSKLFPSKLLLSVLSPVRAALLAALAVVALALAGVIVAIETELRT